MFQNESLHHQTNKKFQCVLLNSKIQQLKHMYVLVCMLLCIIVLYPFFMGGYHSIIRMKNKHGRNEQTILRKTSGTNGIGHIVDIKMNCVVAD